MAAAAATAAGGPPWEIYSSRNWMALEQDGKHATNNTTDYNRSHKHEHSHNIVSRQISTSNGISQFKSPCDKWLFPAAGCLGELKEVRFLVMKTGERVGLVRCPYISFCGYHPATRCFGCCQSRCELELLIVKQGRLGLQAVAACEWSRGGPLHKR